MSSTLKEHLRSGRPAEVGRYRISGGERVLVATADDAGLITVRDRCAEKIGRSYHVESGIPSVAELAGVVRHYKAEAAELGRPPMSRTATDGALGALARVLRENGR